MKNIPHIWKCRGIFNISVLIIGQLATSFVTGIPHLCLWETLSATLQGWPLQSSASWDTSAKQCCCSSFLKWLTFCIPCLSFSTSSPVPGTDSPGNLLLMDLKLVSDILSIILHAVLVSHCLYFFFSFFSLYYRQWKTESRHRQTGDELL